MDLYRNVDRGQACLTCTSVIFLQEDLHTFRPSAPRTASLCADSWHLLNRNLLFSGYSARHCYECRSLPEVADTRCSFRRITSRSLLSTATNSLLTKLATSSPYKYTPCEPPQPQEDTAFFRASSRARKDVPNIYHAPTHTHTQPKQIITIS
jgi:hypothetical protein